MSAADWIAFAICIATYAYVVLVVVTLVYVRKQFNQQQEEKKLQATLKTFEVIQAKEVRASRRYIYEHVPQEIDGLSDSKLIEHLVNAEEAILPYERIGYLIAERHIDVRHILSNHWAEVWKCWKKKEKLIQWAREKRNNRNYLKRFEDLFNAAEEHRIQNGYEEPKIL